MLSFIRSLAFVASLAVSGCGIGGYGGGGCDCPDPGLGLSLHTAGPVTRVALSGDACAGGHFRCVSAASFDDTIHGDCSDVEIQPRAAGTCHVELMVGGRALVVERTMIDEKVAGCCGPGGLVESHHQGDIDLTSPIDAGADTR